MAARLRAAIGETALGARSLRPLARIGYATHGLIYLFMGLLAMAAAVSESRPSSLGGTFSIIDDLPGGWGVLLTLALGLCAYACWRGLDALLDVSRHGWGVIGLLRRAGRLVEAFFYAGMGLVAAAIAVDRSPRIRGELREDATILVAWTGRILDWPLGHWLIAAVGIGAIGVGVLQFVRSRHSVFEDVSAGERAMVAIRLVGRAGFGAKGVIFGAIGVLFLTAAWRVEASAAGGVRAALTALADVPFGEVALLALSAGLVLHGVFGLIKAWLHKPVKP